jgi:hypothetical protein
MGVPQAVKSEGVVVEMLGIIGGKLWKINIAEFSSGLVDMMK